VLSAAVLRDETRIITQATFLRALGRSRSPKAGLAFFWLSANFPSSCRLTALKPFITNELDASTKPAEVYLQFRDASLRATGKIPRRHEGMIRVGYSGGVGGADALGQRRPQEGQTSPASNR